MGRPEYLVYQVRYILSNQVVGQTLTQWTTYQCCYFVVQTKILSLTLPMVVEQQITGIYVNDNHQFQQHL